MLVVYRRASRCVDRMRVCVYVCVCVCVCVCVRVCALVSGRSRVRVWTGVCRRGVCVGCAGGRSGVVW